MVEEVTAAGDVSETDGNKHELIQNKLRAAVHMQDIDYIKKHIEMGLANAADITEVLQTSAAKPELIAITSYLSDKGGNPIDAINTASNNGNIEAVRVLLKHLELNPSKGGKELQHALNFATKNNHLEIMKLLIDKGANTGNVDNEDNAPIPVMLGIPGIPVMPIIPTSMRIAFDTNNKEAITLLVDRGVKIEGDKKSYLSIALSEKKREIAELLIAKGAWVNFIDSDQKKPLDYAIYNDDVAMAELLLKNGARFPKSGMHIMKGRFNEPMEIKYFGTVRSFRMLELLVEQGGELKPAQDVLEDKRASWETSLKEESFLILHNKGKVLSPEKRLDNAHKKYLIEVNEKIDQNREREAEYNQLNLPPMQTDLPMRVGEKVRRP